MVRVVTGKLMPGSDTAPTAEQRRAASRALAKSRRANPLRRVRLACCGWVRDPLASAGDRVWCDTCADWASVTEVAE